MTNLSSASEWSVRAGLQFPGTPPNDHILPRLVTGQAYVWRSQTFFAAGRIYRDGFRSSRGFSIGFYVPYRSHRVTI